MNSIRVHIRSKYYTHILTMTYTTTSENIISGSEKIAKCIEYHLTLQEGAIIGRNGSTELSTILFNFPYKNLEQYSGIFPSESNESMAEWLKVYTEATKESSIFAAGWYALLASQEIQYLKKLSPLLDLIPLRSLEPYYTDHPWTRVLENKRITVVSSFADTMRKQIEKKDDIWEGKYILPNAEYSFVRSYYCPSIAKGSCEWPKGIVCWKTAVEYLYKEILKTKPKIVLIGCGGLAMPLALKLKHSGIISIVLGGAIQILFGIKGSRWEGHKEISEFFNDSWTFPSQNEIPNNAKKIENSCYW